MDRINMDDVGPFDKPVPRPAKSPAQLARIQAQNRRREYLERHPSYYDDLDHELADPLLYERLVKTFQTPAERRSEGQAKGFGRILEADLARGEQRVSDPAAPPHDGRARARAPASPSSSCGDGSSGAGEAWDARPADAEHGRRLWRAFLRERFVRGGDADFEYARVDGADELDGAAARDAQDDWFDDEEPGWVAPGQPELSGDDGGDDEARQRRGETGVQDF